MVVNLLRVTILDIRQRDQIVSYILKGNEMMRRHAEERQSLLKRIINFVKTADETSSNLVSEAINEAANLRNHVNELEIQFADLRGSEALKYQKLKNINKLLEELDDKEKQRDQLVNQLMQKDANITTRDELITILLDYIEVEQAQTHRLVSEISEIQGNIQEAQQQMITYEKLSTRDPRFKALRVLGKHQEGMSVTQLMYMLDVSNFQGRKIINELLIMGLIEKGIGELLKVTDVFETAYASTEAARTELPLTH